jgi:transposase-like protein
VVLRSVSDGELALRAADGDERAFVELVDRYGRVIGVTIRSTGFGGGWEDERQEALIGLLNACRAYRPGRGRFGALAAVCIRHRVWNQRTRTARRSQRILTHAVPLDAPLEGSLPLAERVPAPGASDPALVVELRERLREHADDQRARRARRPPRYTPEQIERALALVAQGKTLTEAGRAVGARYDTVGQWVKRAGRQPSGRSGRRYTHAQISRALTLIEGGASLRQAGAAVGASESTVLRWQRKAA